ncbi:hypothetical protein K1719_014545 [Acacia pycnantha]|nr:hypothetical protein K1719_014545 [Acacia pycnantha]
MAGEIIALPQGWNQVQEGITKLKNILEGLHDEKPFTSREYMNQYTSIYIMCTQYPPYHYYKELYENTKRLLKNTSTLLCGHL